MNNMNNFNISRTLRLARWSLVEERGFAIRTTIIITLLMTFLMTFLSIGGEATYMAYGGDARMQVLMMEKLSKGMSLIFISIYWLVMMVGVSMVFRNMRTKQQRIAYMMLPASNMEKYVTRVVMVALGGLLMSVVSFVLADQLQMVFIKLIFGDTHIGSYVMASASMLSDIASKGVGALKSMGIDIETSFPNSSLYASFAATGMQSGNFLGVWFVLQYLFDMSAFLLMGSLFRRHSWLFACLIYSLVTALIHLIVPAVNIWIPVTLMLVCIVVFVWLSFRVFTRMQVINNKLLNI